MSKLSPLGGTASLDKLAYDKIKDAILTFHFLPNQALIEGELASQLGISKTPVRDALMQLEREGLVSRVPFKGTYVSDLNNQDMADIYEIRGVLEGLAIRLSINNLTDEDFDHLEALVEEHDQSLKRREVANVSRINSDFHNLIISRCSNPRLQKILLLLDDHLKRYRLLSIAQGTRLEKSVPEHRAIVSALKERDPIKAEEAMKSHLESAMKDLYNQDFTELEQILSKTPAG
ncbi:MAG: GntR family transcriptional regulator [Anaerolineaceae bacterium]